MQDSDEIVAIDLGKQTLKSRTPVGPMPADVFGTPDDKFLLVGLTGGDGVEVYDIASGQAKLVKKITTGKGAHAFRALGDKRHVLVSNRAANTISKISLESFTVVDTLRAPGGPDDMEILTDGRTHRGTSGAAVVMRDTSPEAQNAALPWKLLGVHSARMDMGNRDLVLDESLGLNCAWYADILLTLTAPREAPAADA